MKTIFISKTTEVLNDLDTKGIYTNPIELDGIISELNKTNNNYTNSIIIMSPYPTDDTTISLGVGEQIGLILDIPDEMITTCNGAYLFKTINEDQQIMFTSSNIDHQTYAIVPYIKKEWIVDVIVKENTTKAIICDKEEVDRVLTSLKDTGIYSVSTEHLCLDKVIKVLNKDTNLYNNGIVTLGAVHPNFNINNIKDDNKTYLVFNIPNEFVTLVVTKHAAKAFMQNSTIYMNKALNVSNDAFYRDLSVITPYLKQEWLTDIKERG